MAAAQAQPSPPDPNMIQTILAFVGGAALSALSTIGLIGIRVASLNSKIEALEKTIEEMKKQRYSDSSDDRRLETRLRLVEMALTRHVPGFALFNSPDPSGDSQ